MSEHLFVDSPYLVRWEADQQDWHIGDAQTTSTEAKGQKEEKVLLKAIKKQLKEQQKQLYAEQKQALLIVFQAML